MHQIHEQQPLRNLTIDAPTNISSLSLFNSKLLNAKWAKLPSDQQILRGSIRSGENIGPNYPPQLPRLTKLDLSSLHTCRTSDPHQAPSIHTTRFSAPKPKSTESTARVKTPNTRVPDLTTKRIANTDGDPSKTSKSPSAPHRGSVASESYPKKIASKPRTSSLVHSH